MTPTIRFMQVAIFRELELNCDYFRKKVGLYRTHGRGWM